MKIALIVAFALSVMAYSVGVQGQEAPPQPPPSPPPKVTNCCADAACDPPAACADPDTVSCEMTFDTAAGNAATAGKCSKDPAMVAGDCKAGSTKCNCNLPAEKCNSWANLEAAIGFAWPPAPPPAPIAPVSPPSAPVVEAPPPPPAEATTKAAVVTTTVAGGPEASDPSGAMRSIRSDFLCVIYSFAAVAGFSLFSFAHS